MPDISVINDQSIPARIERAGLYPTERKRGYLGMSEIGDPCERKIWLSYHAPGRPKISNRVLRIFDMGDIIEERLILHLGKAGYFVKGQQKSFSDLDGRFQGHCDGEISGLYESSKWHILEIKSANQSSFNAFKKHGICHNKAYGMKYFGQVQLYMHYSGRKRAVIVVENKNNSDLYQERFRYERKHAISLCRKAWKIIHATYPPDGISRKEKFWQCRICSYNTAEYCRKTWEGENLF